jgi:hypothetical protein
MIVKTTVTRHDYLTACGVRPDPTSMEDHVWVECPGDYDPALVTADDIVHDPAVHAISDDELGSGPWTDQNSGGEPFDTFADLLTAYADLGHPVTRVEQYGTDGIQVVYRDGDDTSIDRYWPVEA